MDLYYEYFLCLAFFSLNRMLLIFIDVIACKDIALLRDFSAVSTLEV